VGGSASSCPAVRRPSGHSRRRHPHRRLGGKREADKAKSGRVVAQEDLRAFERLKELVQGLQLDAQYEVVQPPGFVRLNRPNLVVICGPRLSPLLEQILNPIRLGFDLDDDGWYLQDRSTVPCSGPRRTRCVSTSATSGGYSPGRTRILLTYLAGIHAPGRSASSTT
jgi:hypothetical protein